MKVDGNENLEVIGFVPKCGWRFRSSDESMRMILSLLEKLAQVVMCVVLHTSCRDWFDVDAPRGLSAFTNKKTVSGGRTHALPRRRLYGHKRHKAKN